MKKLKWLLVLVLIGIVGYAIYYVNGALPIGTGYAAKYICSQVFMAGRDAAMVFENDVKPTHFLFSVVNTEVNRNDKTVTAKGFGFWRPMTAVYRKGCGCTLAVDTDRDALLKQTQGLIPQKKGNPDLLWPAGEAVKAATIPPEVDRAKLQKVIAEAFREPGPDTMRNTQAVVIVYKGRIVAEQYAKPFTPQTPLLGWSMSKSVTNALVGLLVKENKLDIMKPAPVQAWQGADDPRGKITLDHLLRMSSGLTFDETYAPFKDITIMLFLQNNMADFAAAKSLETAPDNKWHYSGGTTNIIAHIIRDTVGGNLTDVVNFARTRLFDRIGMYSAVIEPDASGSLAGSSYMFATPRDWARFGLLVLNDGVWGGERILPEGWIRYSTTPTPMAPLGEYGAQFWLNAGKKDDPTDRKFPRLPTDMVYLSGFNEQITAILPSQEVVVVRMGATHNQSDWDVERFIRDVLDCLQG